MTEQEAVFWQTIAVFEELKILKNIIVIGGWAEYLFAPLFHGKYIPNTPTRRADFLYKHINKPKQKINLPEELRRRGYACACDKNGVSTFYSGAALQMQFTTRVLEVKKQSQNGLQEIAPLGITATQSRNANILAEYVCTIEQNGFAISVPEPACYAIQKILNAGGSANEQIQFDRTRALLLCIAQNERHAKRFEEIRAALPVKQQRALKPLFLPVTPTLCSSSACSSSGMP